MEFILQTIFYNIIPMIFLIIFKISGSATHDQKYVDIWKMLTHNIPPETTRWKHIYPIFHVTLEHIIQKLQ